MNDPEIREVLLASLRASRPGALLVQELDVSNGRADVAVIGRHYVEGIEIKSAADSMRRLQVQVPAYGRVFDWCTLVTSRSHMAHAARTLPTWWGLTLVEHGRLELARPPGRNPDAQPWRLLWCAELRRLITLHDLRARCVEVALQRNSAWEVRSGRFSKWTMTEALASLPPDELGPMVCSLLRARVDWRLPDGRSAEGARIRSEQAKKSPPRRAV